MQLVIFGNNVPIPFIYSCLSNVYEIRYTYVKMYVLYALIYILGICAKYVQYKFHII